MSLNGGAVWFNSGGGGPFFFFASIFLKYITLVF